MPTRAGIDDFLLAQQRDGGKRLVGAIGEAIMAPVSRRAADTGLVERKGRDAATEKGVANGREVVAAVTVGGAGALHHQDGRMGRGRRG